MVGRKTERKREKGLACTLLSEEEDGVGGLFRVLQSHCCVDVSDPAATFVGGPACLW